MSVTLTNCRLLCKFSNSVQYGYVCIVVSSCALEQTEYGPRVRLGWVLKGERAEDGALVGFFWLCMEWSRNLLNGDYWTPFRLKLPSRERRHAQLISFCRFAFWETPDSISLPLRHQSITRLPFPSSTHDYHFLLFSDFMESSVWLMLHILMINKPEVARDWVTKLFKTLSGVKFQKWVDIRVFCKDDRFLLAKFTCKAYFSEVFCPNRGIKNCSVDWVLWSPLTMHPVCFSESCLVCICRFQ